MPPTVVIYCMLGPKPDGAMPDQIFVQDPVTVQWLDILFSNLPLGKMVSVHDIGVQTYIAEQVLSGIEAWWFNLFMIDDAFYIKVKNTRMVFASVYM
jgi:hypothetical protein